MPMRPQALLVSGLAAFLMSCIPEATNDHCADATPIDALPFEDKIDTRDATPEGLFPLCTIAGNSHSVWYRLVPPRSGYICVRTCGSNYDTSLEVLPVPTCPAPPAVVGGSQCNTQGCGVQAELNRFIAGGQPLYVRVGGERLQGGDLRLFVGFEDVDSDGDGVLDCSDTCPLADDPEQEDLNGNELGDACEDSDRDGLLDSIDNCPLLSSANSTDADADGAGDVCDNCTEVANGPLLPDAGGNVQLDSDRDQIGNLCDADFDQDNMVSQSDVDLFRLRFGRPYGVPYSGFHPEYDLNGDSGIGVPDFNLLRSALGSRPGPSGLSPNGPFCPPFSDPYGTPYPNPYASPPYSVPYTCPDTYGAPSPYGYLGANLFGRPSRWISLAAIPVLALITVARPRRSR